MSIFDNKLQIEGVTQKSKRYMNSLHVSPLYILPCHSFNVFFFNVLFDTKWFHVSDRSSPLIISMSVSMETRNATLRLGHLDG